MKKRPKRKPTISCSRCVDPGMCCRSFPLNKSFEYGSPLSIIVAWLKENGLSFFRPQRRYNVWTADGKTWEQWHFSCTRLLKNGRCGAYADRPALCKSYEPGSDMMCVHVRDRDGRPVVPQKRRPT